MKLLALQDIPSSVGSIARWHEFVVDERTGAQLLKDGKAALPGTRLYFDELPWRGTTVVCIASGPSLTAQDCETVRRWRAGAADRRVIVINTSYLLAPWADMLYACDGVWWRVNIEKVRKDFQGALWTQDEEAARFGVRRVTSAPHGGLGRRPGLIHQGANSGYQVVNLAYQAGADRIVLLGYDMQAAGARKHWHGDHPLPMGNNMRFEFWAASFDNLAKDLRAAGVDVVNATRSTALKCFPKESLETSLETCPVPHP